MANVELVIKIPSEVYENIKSATADDNDISSLLLGIHEATPLPKGHGELIDRGELPICPIDITDLPQDKCLMVYLADDVDNAEVIIAADKERKNEKPNN